METVLFICTYNSVRSQIAEALLRSRCGEKYMVFSAGIAPAGINPYAVKVMQEIGIDISQARSKSLTVFAGKKFDHVITLCDQARLAASSTLPHGNYNIHQGFTSPSEIRRNKKEIIGDFRKLRDEISSWLLEIFPDCASRVPEDG
jgi:arsenate reductase (thioredoxin)